MIDSDDLLKLAMSGRPLFEQRALLKQGLLERGFSEIVVDAVMAETGAGIIFRETSEASRSRVGGAGNVRLPTGAAWPQNGGRPLPFLFELDLSELVGLSEISVAPSTGTLLIFQSNDFGDELSYLSATRVLFRSADDPGVVTTEGSGYDQQLLGQRNLFGFASPLVDTGVDLYGALLARFGEQEVDDLWTALREEGLSVLMLHAQSHRFLGPPAAFQNPLPEVIADWFSQPESSGDRQHFSDSERRGEGWSLLFQPVGIASNAANGRDLEWQSGGERFYMIPTGDLHARQFDRVITVFEG